MPSFRAATAPRMIISVLTGKNGLCRKRVMPCCLMNRSVSSFWYSGLFLMPALVSAGERLLVSLKTPPSSTGRYSNLTPWRFSMSGMTRWLR